MNTAAATAGRDALPEWGLARVRNITAASSVGAAFAGYYLRAPDTQSERLIGGVSRRHVTSVTTAGGVV